MGSLTELIFIAIIIKDTLFVMSEEFTRIASALERIADSLEKKWHIDIDHGHIESIDNIEHGDVDVHNHSF
tara:strand:- start:10 stop:222 length:213 start_codon:yes stop_codon:yes gene_type:complete